MNTLTGEIMDLTEVEKLPKKKQKNFIPVPDDQIEAVRGMNRADRRKWAKEQKRKVRPTDTSSGGQK